MDMIWNFWCYRKVDKYVTATLMEGVLCVCVCNIQNDAWPFWLVLAFSTWSRSCGGLRICADVWAKAWQVPTMSCRLVPRNQSRFPASRSPEPHHPSQSQVQTAPPPMEIPVQRNLWKSRKHWMWGSIIVYNTPSIFKCRRKRNAPPPWSTTGG